MSDEDIGTVASASPPTVRAVDLAPIESFEEFYRREFPMLVALARAVLGGGLADDLAQEAMLVVFRQWKRVSMLNQPQVWARRVCLNLSRSALRRRRVESRALRRLDAPREDPSKLEPVNEEFWAAVRALPRRQIEAVALRYIYDLDVPAVAATMGCSEGSAKSHLARARAALSSSLRDGNEVT